jgi:aflatoxin B1 aldehyde reductase
MATMRSAVVLGTMIWGKSSAQVKYDDAVKQLELFVSYGGEIIDTARIYHFGETEELIGEILKSRPDLGQKLKIHSKAHPIIAPLHAEGLNQQLTSSLKALGRPYLDVFYLHQPDIKVPLLETLKACDKHFQEGKFKELGLSNYAAWDVSYAHYLCEKHQLKIRPTVYQGIMNAICRTIEPELLPCIRTFGMRCYVYNPLAGGMLTGRYTRADEEAKSGRFSPEFDLVPQSMPDHPMKRKAHLGYRTRYWKTDVFHAVDTIRYATQAAKISMVDAALRWSLYHSALKTQLGDGIIFGASSAKQVDQNLKTLLNKDIPEAVLNAIDRASTDLYQQEGYFRGYDVEPGRSKQYLSKF